MIGDPCPILSKPVDLKWPSCTKTGPRFYSFPTDQFMLYQSKITQGSSRTTREGALVACLEAGSRQSTDNSENLRTFCSNRLSLCNAIQHRINVQNYLRLCAVKKRTWGSVRWKNVPEALCGEKTYLRLCVVKKRTWGSVRWKNVPEALWGEKTYLRLCEVKKWKEQVSLRWDSGFVFGQQPIRTDT
jgi:hypothetical protein